MSELKQHIVFENNLDSRTIFCACGNPKCRIGIHFDSEPSIMFLQDKFGNSHAFHLIKENIKLLIEHLKQYK